MKRDQVSVRSSRPAAWGFDAVRAGGARLTADETSLAVAALKERLRGHLGAEAARRWAEGLHVIAAEERRVILAADSEEARARLLDRVGLGRLSEMWVEVDPMRRELVFNDADVEPVRAAPSAAVEPARAASPVPPIFGPREAESPSGAPTMPRKPTFENFVLGEANRDAFHAASALADAAEPPFKVAVVHGCYGAGKSHLLMAAAAYAQSMGALAAMYFNADRFRAEFVRSLKNDAALAFKDEVRGCDLLIIDDLHLLGGAKSTQIEAAHTIDEVLARGGRVLVACDRPIKEIADLDDRLLAKLVSGASCAIDKPDLPLRRQILARMAADNPAVQRGAEFSEEVIDFIASAIVNTPRELEAALATVLLKTVLVSRPLTRESAIDALADMINGSTRRVSVEEIQKQVANYHGIQIQALLSKKRTRDIVRPRQQAMFLCKEFTTRSLPDIARRFSGMDHTTVMHACKRIRELCQTDPGVRADIEALRRILKQRQQRPAAP